MLIDAHHHFWHPARGDYGWMVGEAVAPIAKPFHTKDLQPLLVKAGIQKTVLVQAAPTIEETEYMLGIADTCDFVAKVVGWINFEDKSQIRQLERLKAHPKFAGVRPMIQDIPDTNWMHLTDVQWAYQALIDLDLTFDALGFPIHLDSFAELFSRYPNLRCVVDHCVKPQIQHGAFAPWAEKIKRVASETNSFCKISGLVTEAQVGWNVETLRPYVEHVLESFGQNRVMWGSDWPVVNLNGDYSSWLGAARELVPREMQADVFGDTAREFYRID